ncbi:Transposon Ty3-G Gag-Pol poly, partial [Paramuricea clavata]
HSILLITTSFLVEYNIAKKCFSLVVGSSARYIWWQLVKICARKGYIILEKKLQRGRENLLQMVGNRPKIIGAYYHGGWHRGKTRSAREPPETSPCSRLMDGKISCWDFLIERDSSNAVRQGFSIARVVPDRIDCWLGHTNILTHEINTGNSTPIKQHPRRIPFAHLKKKDDSLANSHYFSTLDLKSAYWQISVEEKDRHKTAFVTQRGLFEFNRMPFGLVNLPTTFQRAMDLVLSGLSYVICLCYLDDVIVFGRDFNEHCNRLKTVLERLRSHNLRVKLAKCTIAAPQVAFLGHVVTESGIMPDPAKIEAVNNITSPRNIKDIRSFLGLAGYYRKFIPGFSSIAMSLLQLTHKAAQFNWTDAYEQAFQRLKHLLCSAPILAYPDFSQAFILQTDASDYGVGAVLSQLDELGNEKVIAYASKALSPREQKYSTTEKEAFAVVFGKAHFRVYLLGRHFKLITDHSALRWLHTMEAKGRLARWIMDIQEFDFSVAHRAGRIHNNADALSRLVQANSSDSTTSITKDASQPVFVSTIRVKLSGGCTAIVKRAVPSSPQDLKEVNTITLNPTMNLRDSQRADSHLASIIDMKTRKSPKPKLTQIQDPALKSWFRHYDQYFVHDEILYRALGSSNSSHPQHVMLIPPALQANILKTLHDGPLGGHLGITRTEERVRKRFYWPGIRKNTAPLGHISKQVSEYVVSVRILKREVSLVPRNENTAPLGHISVSQPFTFWAMDYMGPLPETGRGNKHILVVVDHFTKCKPHFLSSEYNSKTGS